MSSVFFWEVHCFKEKPHKQLFSNGFHAALTGAENMPEKISSEYCGRCHSDIYRNWKMERHANSWTNDLFQKAYKIETKDWCIHCHAPLEMQKISIKNGNENAGLIHESEGINCAGCHIRNGKGVSLEYLKKPEFCAECHQFNFPVFQGENFHYSSHPMQDTFQEWKKSNSKKTCQECHFKNHRLEGPHSKDWLKEQFTDFTAFTDGGPVTISFKLKDHGHRSPTGDLFRSFVLEASTDHGFKKIYFRKKWARFFMDGFLEKNVIWKRNLKVNSGFFPEESSVSVTIDRPADVIYARFIYYFHDPDLGGKTDLPPEKTQIIIWQKKIN